MLWETWGCREWQVELTLQPNGKRFFQFAALTVIVFSIWHFWDPLWKYNINEAVDKNSTEKVVFEIEKGESAKSIADSLDDKNLLVDYRAF